MKSFWLMWLLSVNLLAADCPMPASSAGPRIDELGSIRNHVEKSVECSAKAILEASREQVFPDTEAAISTGSGAMLNPFFIDPPRSSDEIERPVVRKARLLKPFSPTRTREDLFSLAGQIREDMMTTIRAGKSDEDLSPAKKIMIQRLKALTLHLDDCTGAEAQNVSTESAIRFCQNALKTPELALVQLIAHELGHTLDPCGLESRCYHNVRTDKPLDQIITISNPVALQDVASPAVTQFTDTFVRTNPDDLKSFQTLVSSGVIAQLDPGVPRAQNPTMGTLNCLADQGRTRPPKEGSGICETEFTEGGAQIWSARITADYIKNNPPQSLKEKMGLFANSLPNFGGKPGKTNKELDMDQLFLREPEIQKMFNCRPVQEKNCTEEFRP